MKGIVITTPDFADMADVAACRFEHFTGLRAEVRCVETKEQAHRTKRSLTGMTWVLDADLWFVRHVALPHLQPNLIYATPAVPADKGRAFIRARAAAAGVDPSCWFSGGIYGADFDCPLVRQALAEAERYAQVWHISGRDEEPMNAGVQRAGVTVALLPSVLNWHPHCGCNGYGYEPRQGPAAIHAGGIPAAEKLTFLRAHCPLCE